MRLAQLKSLFRRTPAVPNAVQQQLNDIFLASPLELPAKLKMFETTFQSAVQQYSAQSRKLELLEPQKYLSLAMQGVNMQSFVPKGSIEVDPSTYYQIAAKGLEMPNLVVLHSLTSVPKDLTKLPFAEVRGSVFLLDTAVKHVDLLVTEALYSHDSELETISPRSTFGVDKDGVSLVVSNCRFFKELDVRVPGSVSLAHSAVEVIKSSCRIGKDKTGLSLSVALCDKLTQLDVSVPGSVNASASAVCLLGPNFSCGIDVYGFSLTCERAASVLVRCERPQGTLVGTFLFDAQPKALEF